MAEATRPGAADAVVRTGTSGTGAEADDDRYVRIERDEWLDAEAHPGADRVVHEEPLEIRIGGISIAVVMRTPGNDEDLVRGFLLSERVVDRTSDIVSIRHCTDVDLPAAEDNVMQVVLRPEVRVDLARLRRNIYASSSCGICGKATIEQVLEHAPPLSGHARVAAKEIYALPGRLRQQQDVFERTGGLHAAGLFTLDGSPLVVREDVGRHNAVDKVLGWALLHRQEPLREHVLMVSGRISYEIVQKALAARIPVVAAVSAPSSLAIELGRASNMTLIGFVRGRRMCVYVGSERVVG